MSGGMGALLALPIIIDEPGSYLTRSGDLVTIDRVSESNSFQCAGSYDDCKTPESWHRSGRLYFPPRETPNDIVAKLQDDEFASPEEVQAARDRYGCEEIEIDEPAKVSRSDEGHWIQAWVWMGP